MAPPGRRVEGSATVEERQAPKPAMGQSTMLNREGLGKVLFMVAASSGEWGPTKILPFSIPPVELTMTSIALHLPGLLSGLLPPFTKFFKAMLTHYQIHALHLELR
ncbi:hypothetical protein D1007_45578 [Hordeum vulgare]|nr:hypothetical protein D1007_45578 [Hordeum vulgare]